MQTNIVVLTPQQVGALQNMSEKDEWPENKTATVRQVTSNKKQGNRTFVLDPFGYEYQISKRGSITQTREP